MIVFVNLSVMVNLVCWLDYDHFFENVYLPISLWGLLHFSVMFNLMLNGVSFLLTCCRLHIAHSIGWMAYFVWQFVLWNIFKVLFVCWHVNVVVILKVCKSFLTLLFYMKWAPVISWMFLFCLNYVVGSVLKKFFKIFVYL